MDQFLSCHIRKIQLIATEEEIVRQTLLLQMTGTLGFPKSYIVVEKSLSEFANNRLHPPTKTPNRRIDVLAYGKHDMPSGIQPLLLVECKKRLLQNRIVQRQVFGYNHYIQAPFVLVLSQDHSLLFCAKTASVLLENQLPSYTYLLDRYSAQN